MNTVSGLLTNLAVYFAAFGFVANICIAIGVHADAKKLQADSTKALSILTPRLWSISCLFGGVLVLAIYAALHYSILRKEKGA